MQEAKSILRRSRSLALALTLCALPACFLAAQQPAEQSSPRYPLTVDRDPVSSPDPEPGPGQVIAKPGGQLPETVKEGSDFAFRQRVEEVVLNVTVLDEKGNLILDLKPEEFRILEDGVQQKIRSFQRQDLPVSIGIVVDNSGSMSKKRKSVATAVLDLIKASNPDDEAFLVNFNDRAYLDQEFTHDPAKLRDAIINLRSDGTTALYDAVVASADELAAHAARAKQVLVVVTDGDDNDSNVSLEDCIHKVQQLEGPVVYSIGLLFGDEMTKKEAGHARKALELLSGETGGITYEPRTLDEVDSIANEVARDIRSQYTIGYSSTKPYSLGGYRKVVVEVKSKRYKKLFVRTRPGYFPLDKKDKSSAKAEQPPAEKK
jgi:VWFA-related protein